MSAQRNSIGPGWQIWVGLFVAVGIVATIAYTIIENFYG